MKPLGKRGYVTIASGAEKYYILAVNLLRSYRYHTPSDHVYPFCIISNKRNSYADLFDDQVIIDNLPCSYLSKIELLKYSPYEETIFIDADCLIYRDLYDMWHYFSNCDSLGIFGHKLPLSNLNGWFQISDVGVWGDKCNFCLVTHGGIMYLRTTPQLKKIYDTCLEIVPNYSDYTFQIFSSPADEPIIALSMAVNNCSPVEYSGLAERAYCFMPVRENIKMNIRKGILSYGKNPAVKDVLILHWQNNNTRLPIYKREVDRMSLSESDVALRFYLRSFLFFFYGVIPANYYRFKSFIWKLLH